jgi:Tetratricopeptide repeat
LITVGVRSTCAAVYGVMLVSLAVLSPSPAFAQPSAPLQRATDLLAEVSEHMRKGQYREAIAPAREALALREQALSPDHPDFASMLSELGGIREHEGDFAGARPLHERALAIYERRHGPNHPDVALALNRLRPYDLLSNLLLKLHERDESRGYDRDAWAVLEAKKGRLVTDALAAARPKVRDPAVRKEVEQLRDKEQKARALARELADERDRAGTKQDEKRVESLTTLLAQTKAEYLAQAQTLLVRYPSTRRSSWISRPSIPRPWPSSPRGCRPRRRRAPGAFVFAHGRRGRREPAARDRGDREPEPGAKNTGDPLGVRDGARRAGARRRVITLAAAFSQAGAQSIVASLWKVNGGRSTMEPPAI